MDYGAIAGSLEGLYGGIKTGMAISQARHEQKLNERKMAIAEEEAKQRRETYEAQKPILETSRQYALSAKKYMDQLNNIDSRLEKLDSMTANDNEMYGNIGSLISEAKKGNHEALEVINNSGMMTNAVAVPEYDEEGRVIGYGVKGRLPTGVEAHITPELLSVYEQQANSSLNAIKSEREKLLKKRSDYEMILRERLGMGAGLAERREAADTGKQLEIYKMIQSQKNKQRDQDLKAEANDIKREANKGKMDKDAAKEISKNLSDAAKAKDEENKSDLLEEALRGLVDVDQERYASIATSLFSFGEDNIYKIKSIIGPALGTGITDDRAIEFYKKWIKDPEIPLTPDNIRSLAKGGAPSRSAMMESEIEVPSPTLPMGTSSEGATVRGKGLQPQGTPSPAPKSPRQPTSSPDVQVINSVPNENGEIEVLIDGQRGFVKAGR